MRYAIAIRTWTIVITMLSAKPISSFRDQFSYGVLVLLQSTSPYSSAASRGFSDLRAAPGPLLRGPRAAEQSARSGNVQLPKESRPRKKKPDLDPGPNPNPSKSKPKPEVGKGISSSLLITFLFRCWPPFTFSLLS
jgi:hypothetical protein